VRDWVACPIILVMERKEFYRRLTERLDSYLLEKKVEPAEFEVLDPASVLMEKHKEHILDSYGITRLGYEEGELNLYLIVGTRSSDGFAVRFSKHTEKELTVIDGFSYADDGLGVRVFVENEQEFDEPIYYNSDIETFLLQWSGPSRKKYH